MARKLNEIAVEIALSGEKIPNQALPYLDAMGDLETIEDMYGYDGGKEIVLRFLCNAGLWRGEMARRIKAELKQICGVR